MWIFFRYDWTPSTFRRLPRMKSRTGRRVSACRDLNASFVGVWLSVYGFAQLWDVSLRMSWDAYEIDGSCMFASNVP